MRASRTIVIAVASAALLGGCSSGGPLDGLTGGGTIDEVSGTVIMPGKQKASGCVTDPGYSDVYEGADVALINGSRFTIAMTELEEPTWQSTYNGSNGGYCAFEFTWTDVPTDEESYGLQVGNDERGNLDFTVDELREGDIVVGIARD